MATGRTVLLEGFLEVLENTLGISVRLGRISNPDIASCVSTHPETSGQKYLTYITSLGLICQALRGEEAELKTPHKQSSNLLFRAINKINEVYQEYF